MGDTGFEPNRVSLGSKASCEDTTSVIQANDAVSDAIQEMVLKSSAEWGGLNSGSVQHFLDELSHVVANWPNLDEHSRIAILKLSQTSGWQPDPKVKRFTFV